MFIKGRRAVQMVLGVGLAVVFFYFALWTRLETVSWLLTTILPYFVFRIIIVFQSEIRRALAHFGKTAFFRRFSANQSQRVLRRDHSGRDHAGIESDRRADRDRARHRTEKLHRKRHRASTRRCPTICWLQSSIRIVPLHDGAVIVQNGRIAAAACFLPLTVKPRLSKELGTRHRAAIGVTEETDAVAIVVSEETGSLRFRARRRDRTISRPRHPASCRLREAFEREDASSEQLRPWSTTGR